MATDLTIGIGDFWLTDDGTEDGLPCDLDVAGDLPALKQKWWGSASRNARGNPEMNLTEVAGVELSFVIPMLGVEILNSIQTMFDEALDDDEDFPLVIEGGAIISLDLAAAPNPDNAIRWKSTIEGMALDVEIRVITKAVEE